MLRDEVHPIRVDHVNRFAILDEMGAIRTGAAEALGKENDVQIEKIGWLSNSDSPKAYGSMVVYLTKDSDYNVAKTAEVHESLMNDNGIQDVAVLAIQEPHARLIKGHLLTTPMAHHKWTKMVPSTYLEGRWAIRSMLWIRNDLEADQVTVESPDMTAALELACGFIVNTDQPFGVFDDRYLRELLQQFDQDLFSQIPWSRSSQRRQLEVVFDSKKCLVQQSLREAITKIHVAFDLWTSPNRYAIVAVSGHFLDKEGRQQQRLLALTRQPGPHAGENIAHTLRRVVEDWQIEDMIGTLVSDNATNNDTCADHFFRAIEPALTQGDRVERRMRCYGHILNLVGRAFLNGEDGETFEQESQRLLDADLIEDDLRHWRRRGPVGRLRNIIKFIRASPQRSERFQTLANEADDQDAWLIHQESSRELQLILSNEAR
ncbi:transposase [Purpureocillium lilacinum]|uniref:Transposase n=1 Tax=Purpureocillium lilacinum TaxID=33203 RepID=A0A179F5Z3_PURLI|nr:transposase [Purpureocillium lilacinum]